MVVLGAGQGFVAVVGSTKGADTGGQIDVMVMAMSMAISVPPTPPLHHPSPQVRQAAALSSGTRRVQLPSGARPPGQGEGGGQLHGGGMGAMLIILLP